MNRKYYDTFETESFNRIKPASITICILNP